MEKLEMENESNLDQLVLNVSDGETIDRQFDYS